MDVVAAELRRGNIAVIPTDTIYGFSGLIGKTAEAIARRCGGECGVFDKRQPFGNAAPYRHRCYLLRI